MAGELARHGLYFDDFYSLRVLELEISAQTSELRDECKYFSESNIKNMS